MRAAGRGHAEELFRPELELGNAVRRKSKVPIVPGHHPERGIAPSLQIRKEALSDKSPQLMDYGGIDETASPFGSGVSGRPTLARTETGKGLGVLRLTNGCVGGGALKISIRKKKHHICFGFRENLLVKQHKLDVPEPTEEELANRGGIVHRKQFSGEDET
jgi:hypothetical protein